MDNTNQPVPPVQNIEQSQSAPLPNPPSHSKIFIIIASVILLTMISVGTYALGTRKNPTVIHNEPITTSPTIPQPSPTANWKTYRNQEFGFEVRYPSDFGNPQESKESFTAYFQGSVDYPYSMIINGITGEKSLNKYLTKLDADRAIAKKETPSSKVYILGSIQLTIGGNLSIQREMRNSSGFESIETWIDVTPKGIVQVGIWGKDKSVSELHPLNNQILSTFRFD